MKQTSSTPRTPNPARRVAYTILMIGFIALAFTIPLTLTGETTLALQICVGGLALGAVVLLFGALVVAVSRPDNSDTPDENAG